MLGMAISLCLVTAIAIPVLFFNGKAAPAALFFSSAPAITGIILFAFSRKKPEEKKATVSIHCEKNSSVEDPLVDFYLLGRPNKEGRTFTQILAQNDDWFEDTHDFVQWIFPNRKPSKFNPGAPCLTDARLKLLKTDEGMAQAKKAFDRFLRFLGLCIEEETIVKGENWEKNKVWLSRTHNYLRITRVLKFLKEMELDLEANAFLKCLKTLSDSPLYLSSLYDCWEPILKK